MGVLGILATGAVVAFLFGRLARRFGHSVWWGIGAPAIAVLLLWLGGTGWIFSSACRDVQTCDSGGWLAFSASMVIVLALVMPGALIGCLAARRS